MPLSCVPRGCQRDGDVVLQSFKAADTRRDGTISRTALARLLNGLGSKWSEDYWDPLLQRIDLRGDGRINYEELVAWLFRSPGHLGHPLRGVSVHLVAATLLREVRAAGLARDATVYDAEPAVIRPKGEAIRCPRDGRLGAAYVDCVEGHDSAGAAQFMLSYTWGYAVADIAATLTAFCDRKGLDRKRTYFWICCLCVNQHRVKEVQQSHAKVPFEEFRATFGARVQGIGRIVAMMAPWRAPLYLTRVWCSFEMFTAINVGAEVEVVMPPSQTLDLQHALHLDSGLEDVWASLARVNIEHAKASVPEDEENILNLIRSGPGFKELNITVSQRMKTWFLVTTRHALDVLLGAQGGNTSNTARLCQQIGMMNYDMGRLGEAMECLTKGLQLRQSIGALETLEGAALLRGIGRVSKEGGNFPAAVESYEAAKGILERAGALETPEGAALCRNIGNIKKRRGDLEGACECFEEAKRICELIGTLDTLLGAELTRNIGDAELLHGKLGAALANYEVALDIHARTDTLETPNGAKVLAKIAILQIETGDIDAALEGLEMARDIRQRTGTLESPDGAEVLRHIGRVSKHRGDFAAASTSYEAARDIFNNIGAMETPDGAALLRNLGNLRRCVGDLDGAFRCYSQAECICECTGMLETTMAAELSRSIGDATLERGDEQGALKRYMKAHIIHERTGTADTYSCAKLLTKIANLRLETGDVAAALESIMMAMGIRERTGTLESTDGADVLCILGRVRQARGDCDAAIESYQRARDIRGRTGSLASPDGCDLLERIEAARRDHGQPSG